GVHTVLLRYEPKHIAKVYAGAQIKADEPSGVARIAERHLASKSRILSGRQVVRLSLYVERSARARAHRLSDRTRRVVGGRLRCRGNRDIAVWRGSDLRRSRRRRRTFRLSDQIRIRRV